LQAAANSTIEVIFSFSRYLDGLFGTAD